MSDKFIGGDLYQPNGLIGRTTVIGDGAVGYDRLTGRYKVGDGVTPWDFLDYVQAELVEGLIIGDGGVIEILLSTLTDVNLTGLTGGQVLTYNAGQGKWINADSAGGTGTVSEEDVQDIVGEMFSNNAEVAYDDATGKINITFPNTGLTSEEATDISGNLVGASGSAGIATSYNEVTNQLSISLSGEEFTSALKSKLDSLPSNADNTSDNETSHADVIVDGDFTQNGFMKRSSLGVYTVDDSTYQSELVSGTNIKTINNQSLLGSGDIAIAGAGGDMLKSAYDTNNNGVVDNAEKVNNLTVLTAVPSNALFTDTVYTKPSSEPISYIVDLQSTLNGKQPSLVSGTNIKTINGQTVLGSGNITIEAGESDFLSLTDTPSTYVANKIVKVNATGDAIEFADEQTTSASWGGIIGTIGDQNDLSDALGLKVNTSDVKSPITVGNKVVTEQELLEVASGDTLNIDGGRADSVYTAEQLITGGNA